MDKYNTYIAIDPDSTKSGIAILNKDHMMLDYMAYSFPHILGHFDIYDMGAMDKDEIKVIIEAGWLNHGNYHLGGFNSPQRASKIGWAIGRNHQTGMLLAEILTHKGFNVELVKPLKKIGKGKDGKISTDELNDILKEYGIAPVGRCNQDVRDAILLCLNHSGLTPKNNFKNTKK